MPEPLFSVRPAKQADVPYIDSLQKKHGEAVGFLGIDWIRKLIIEQHAWVGTENGAPACYLIGKATYRDRLDVGIVYQACVQYDAQRRHLGAALVASYLSAMPETCRAIILWCAQDLEANYFWRSMGFDAIAWRAGSKRKGRIHILWEGNVPHNAPLESRYLPSKTTGGVLRGDRLVFPLKDGETWVDPKRFNESMVEREIVLPSERSTDRRPKPKAVRPPRPARVKGGPHLEFGRSLSIFHQRLGLRAPIVVAGREAEIPKIISE